MRSDKVATKKGRPSKLDKVTMYQANVMFMIIIIILFLLLSVTVIKIGDQSLFDYIKASLGDLLKY